MSSLLHFFLLFFFLGFHFWSGLSELSCVNIVTVYFDQVGDPYDK